MDGVESIGMPVSLPLAEVPGQTPYSVSLYARKTESSGGGIRKADESAPAASQQDEREKQIGKDFESVLLTKLFDEVQASIEDSGFDEQDSGGGQIRGMFWLYLAQDVADKGGLGLWKDIYQYIKRTQDAANPVGSVDEEL